VDVELARPGFRGILNRNEILAPAVDVPMGAANFQTSCYVQ
jgi:hypothetical protein